MGQLKPSQPLTDKLLSDIILAYDRLPHGARMMIPISLVQAIKKAKKLLEAKNDKSTNDIQ